MKTVVSFLDGKNFITIFATDSLLIRSLNHVRIMQNENEIEKITLQKETAEFYIGKFSKAPDGLFQIVLDATDSSGIDFHKVISSQVVAWTPRKNTCSDCIY